MFHTFQPEQKFTMTNPDYNVIEEAWTVVSVDYPRITFSVWRRWVVDTAYVRPVSTEPYVADVVRADATGFIIVDAHYSPWANWGYRIEGEHITYLDKALFAWYASRSEPI